MVNRGKKKSDSSDRSSRATVRNMAHSNNVNGESAPHNTSNCSSGSRKKSTSGESTEQLQALDPSNDSVFNSLRQDTTSVEVQTEKQSDLMINFLALPQEERMSSLCEMLSTIDPLEVRLAAACLEGIRTTQSSQLKHLEIRANTSAAVDNIRNQQLTMENYQKCVDAVYALVTLLTPANRPIAMQYIGCIERLISERIRINPEYTNIADRVKALRLIFRLVSACIHHPAFPGDFRVRMTVVIDDLQQEIWDAQRQIQEANHAGPDAEGESAFQSVSECGAPSGASSFHFINKFEATLAHDDNFCIQMIWNDGERTFARRTRREIFELHHKLLDLFGEERREQTKRSHEDAAASCSGMSDGTRRVSNEVQNAERERSRTNSNTTTGNELAVDRLLPYLHMDSSPTTFINYINGLSNLPTRIMMSSIIYEEFYASRYKTADFERGLASQETSVHQQISSPYKPQPGRHFSAFPIYATFAMPQDQVYATTQAPMAYSPAMIPPVFQVFYPSCSNCGESHPYYQCLQTTLLDEKK